MSKGSAICPCDSGRGYAQCCEPYHHGDAAADAETLMRSRYSAYVLKLDAYLLRTWHATQRPAVVDADPNVRWLGLAVGRHSRTSADSAHVEFVARYRVGGASASRLHEISRFVRENGEWYYVDGEFPDANARADR